MASDFNLALPDIEQTKTKVEEELALPAEHVEVIDDTANQKGAEIMAVDMNSFDDRKAITMAIDQLGSDIVTKSATKNEILSRRMATLAKGGEESSEITKGLEDLSIAMRDLDPSNVDFAKQGPLSKLFNPVRRYFEKYKSADAEIADIVQSLEKGKTSLKNDNTTLELEENTMRELTVKLNQQIEMANELDVYLTNAVEQAKASGDADPEKIKFVEEEVMFPLRQKIMDFQQLQVVNQQGIVSMNIIRRNNQELIRAVDRAENVTVSALRVAVTVAGALYNQRIVLDKVNTLNQATNDMISATSRMLKEQGSEIQQAASEANISTETLKASFADTIQALEDISKFKQEALPRIKQTIADFEAIAAEGNKYVERLERPLIEGDGSERPLLQG